MRDTEVEIWLHLVWGTWNREPLISPEIERVLYRSLSEEAQHCDCRVLAIGGVEDHVHLLMSLPSTRSLSSVVQRLKGVSSRIANTECAPIYPFKWQGSYGAFSVGVWDLVKAARYIRNQKEHHATGKTIARFESFLQEKDVGDAPEADGG